MMPYDTYRMYQVERAKSPGEIQRSAEQAARLASAVAWLFRDTEALLTSPARIRVTGAWARGGPHQLGG